MAPTIASLLKTHPVSLYDNLAKISNALGIDVVETQKPKKAKMQSDIEECVKTFPDYEKNVRDMANEFMALHKEQKTTPEINATPTSSHESQSQELFEESQVMDTEDSQSQNTAFPPKRKFTEDGNSTENQTKIRLCEYSPVLLHEFEKMTNVIESLAGKIDKLENQILTLTKIVEKTDEKMTQSFKDEVTHGLEKLEMDFQIGMTKMTSLIPKQPPQQPQPSSVSQQLAPIARHQQPLSSHQQPQSSQQQQHLQHQQQQQQQQPQPQQ